MERRIHEMEVNFKGVKINFYLKSIYLVFYNVYKNSEI